MTHIERAIRDAVEKGGFKDREAEAGFARTSQREAQIILDPAFWQSLGKARGWQEESTRAEYYTLDSQQREYEDLAEWEYQWHRWDSLTLPADLGDIQNGAILESNTCSRCRSLKS